jgi:hypothetical protein
MTLNDPIVKLLALNPHYTHNPGIGSSLGGFAAIREPPPCSPMTDKLQIPPFARDDNS